MQILMWAHRNVLNIQCQQECLAFLSPFTSRQKEKFNLYLYVLLQPWMVCWRERWCCVYVNWPAVFSSCPPWLPPTVPSVSAAAASWSSPTSCSQVRLKTRSGVLCSSNATCKISVVFFSNVLKGSFNRLGKSLHFILIPVFDLHRSSPCTLRTAVFEREKHCFKQGASFFHSLPKQPRWEVQILCYSTSLEYCLHFQNRLLHFIDYFYRVIACCLTKSEDWFQ